MKSRGYSSHKPSGVDWVGDIPNHWNLKRLKFCSTILMGQSPSSEDYNQEGIGVPFLQGNAEFGPRYPSPRQFCPTATKRARVGDVLVSVRAPVGALNIADQDYGIGRGLCALRFNIKDVESQYGFYLMQVVKQGLQVDSTGSTYDAVGYREVSTVNCVIPALPEQQTIVSFLNSETAKIDALIAKKQCLIELLNEKRAAIISHAVTRGLHPTVPMKDSGIEWLGGIPAHWKVYRLKHVTQTGLRNGLFKTKDKFGRGVKLINVIDMYRDDFRVDLENLESVEADTCRFSN